MLCIQGPPGCDKTYTAARAIVEQAILREGPCGVAATVSHYQWCRYISKAPMFLKIPNSDLQSMNNLMTILNTAARL